jgi:hypothetical protein
MVAAPVPDRLRLPARARWAVLAAAGAGVLAGGLFWPMIDEPNPKFGIAAVITKTGAGTVIGLAAVLLCYAVVWQVRRRVAVSEGA